MLEEDLFNNTQIKKIYDLATKKTIPHAILLESDNKDVCLEVAVSVAKILMCQSRHNVPCNNCESCKKVACNAHPDVEFINPVNSQKTIGIDAIRNLKKSSYIAPNESNYKIYVFPDSSIITPQAQNAFLKILEEPPKSVIFIMICSSRLQLISTITSRLACFKIYGSKCDIDDNLMSEVEKFNEYLLNKNELELLKMTSRYSKKREELKKFLRYSKELFIKNYTHGYGPKLSSEKTVKILDILDKCESSIDKNINMSLLTCHLCSSLISSLNTY